jgi:hypothetical protein
VRAARRALGPDVKLMADAHGRDGVGGQGVCRMVEGCDLYWLEEPSRRRQDAQAEAPRSAVPALHGKRVHPRLRDRGLARRGHPPARPGHRQRHHRSVRIAPSPSPTTSIGAAPVVQRARLRPAWPCREPECGVHPRVLLGANPLLHELVHEVAVVTDGSDPRPAGPRHHRRRGRRAPYARG